MFKKRKKIQAYLASAVTVEDLRFLLWDEKFTEDIEVSFLKRAIDLVKNLDEALILAESANNENIHLRYRILNLFLKEFVSSTDEQLMKLLDIILPQSNLNGRVLAGVLAERAKHDPEAFNETTDYSFDDLVQYAELLHPESKEKMFLRHAIENAMLAIFKRKRTMLHIDIDYFCRDDDIPPLIKANVLIEYLLQSLPLSESDWKGLMCMLIEQKSPFPQSTHRCILATLLEHKPDR